MEYKFIPPQTDRVTVNTSMVPQPLHYYEGIISSWIQDKAKELGFEGTIDAATYVDSDNTEIKNKSLALIEWRDQMWESINQVYQQMEQQGEYMTDGDLLAALPQLQV